ncbi:hypothetical protein ARAM_005052 [Aspergillus rambellii]|uniref:Xylanolytic transcriptional activator regulatory domain-containing protein n=1 Tax=Aspergillus rambellii TaxID=308745 RepID=A0A0F8VVA5_9EURO|nr:hypothetical protein ARAM_005052 [Aspergillus rambellii]
MFLSLPHLRQGLLLRLEIIIPESVCDNDYPVCSNCLKAGAECDKASVRQENGSPNEYTRALEERIAYLESQLQSRAMRPGQSNGQASHPVTAILSPQNQEIGQKGSAAGNSSANGIDHNAVGELVGFLAINSTEAPAYVGSSSGLSLAANLGEMVQATVWNQVLSPSRNQSTLSGGGRGNLTTSWGPGATGLPPQPLPSDKAPGTDGLRTLRMDELLAKSTEPPNDEMGARILHVYLTRLHVRYPFLDRKELWGLHEGRWRLAKTKREELTPAERFVYYLERVVSMSLGRPFSISDRDIDLPLPIDVDDDVRDPGLLPPDSSSPNNKRITTLTFSIQLSKLRRIDSHIQHKIYRADPAALERFSGSDLDYPILHYNRAVRLLIQPFLPSLPLTDPYYHICLRAAGDACQAHKRLPQTLEYGHSFLTVQTVFMAGITLLSALWTHTDRVWSVQMSNDIRACSTVLFVMGGGGGGKRAAWVKKKYRDAFEHLVNAAMEKLEGSEAAKTAGMAELMAAQQQSNAGFAVGTGPVPRGPPLAPEYPNTNTNPNPSADPHVTTTTTTTRVYTFELWTGRADFTWCWGDG